ncbi:hypothetical protein A6R68_04371, partial [Neotoma lepida]
AKLLGIDYVPDAKVVKISLDSMMKPKRIVTSGQSHGQHKQNISVIIPLYGIKCTDQLQFPGPIILISSKQERPWTSVIFSLPTFMVPGSTRSGHPSGLGHLIVFGTSLAIQFLSKPLSFAASTSPAATAV